MNRLTNTFAWFESTKAVTAAKSSENQITATTALGTASEETLHIKLRLNVTTSPELSNAAGNTFYKVGDNYYQASNPINVGVLDVTVEWVENDAATIFADSNNRDQTVTFTVTGDYNSSAESQSGLKVALLGNGTSAADTNMATNNEISIVVTANSSDGSLSKNATNVYYAVRGSYLTVEGARNDQSQDTFTAIGDGDTTHMNIASHITIS